MSARSPEAGFATAARLAPRRQRLALALSLLIAAILASPAVTRADENPPQWWVEITQEREIPTALIASRAEARLKRLKEEKEAAEEKAGEDDKGDAKKKAPVKERIKGLLDKLPKLEPLPGEEAEGAADKADPDEAKLDVTDPLPEDKPAVAGAGGESAETTADDPQEAERLRITVAMAGQIVGLDNENLTFQPSVRPEQELRLALKQITSLSRHAPGREPAQREIPKLEFRVDLRDGSEIPGQLKTMTDTAITVALVGSGAEIELPLAQITRIERRTDSADDAASRLPEAPDRHVAALSTGEIIAGQLLPSRDSDKWLRISSPILTAETPLSLIDLLVFPDPLAAGDAELVLAEEIVEGDEGNNAEAEKFDDEEPYMERKLPAPEVRHLVSLSPAGMLWAKKLQLDGENLLISALGKDSFAVPINRVESVSFGHEGLSSSAPILVWGGYSDEDDEYRKTLEALANHIPPRKMLQNKSKVPDADFLRQLRRSRVLLVPEMEAFKKADHDAAMGKGGKGASSWGEAFKKFLRRGGNIIFLSPTGDALNFFNDAGLGPLRSGGGGGSWKFTAEGKKLGARVAGTVENVNATHYYRKGAPWQTWGAAAAGGDGVTLVGRRLERGWVMTFGADFYETNEQVTETLVRLIEFTGRR